MNSTVELRPLRSRVTSRITSIDVFRGITMLTMIFVNDLAGVKLLPWWTYHMPGNANGMTYVDMVYPTFLFILGMSVPLSVQSRLAKDSSFPRLWTHVVLRSFSLLVLGIALANCEKADPRLMGISRDAWGFLVLLGAVLFWNIYPRTSPRQKIYLACQLSGLVLLVAMFALFRRTTATGQVKWLDFSYWEILGLIGWTYLAVCILYIPTRRWRWAPLFWLIALVVFNALSSAQWVQFGDALPFYLWPFNNGAFPLIAMAGIITTQIFITKDFGESLSDRTTLAAGFSVILFASGWLLSPLGISKNRATPTWCLYSSGAAVLIFLLLYWICDVRQRTSWAAFTRAAGNNTLLTYLLPDMFYFGVGTRWLPPVVQSGPPGVFKSLVFTACIALLATVLTRLKVRLHI